MKKRAKPQVKKSISAAAKKADATSVDKVASGSTSGRISASRRLKIEGAARDFAERFEGVMRELANG